MKKIMFAALASAITLTFVPSMTLAASIPSITTEKAQRVEYNGGILKDNHLYVPVREIFTSLKAPLVWDPKNRTVRIFYKEIAIELQVDSTEGLVNNNLHKLEVPPMMYKGRMYVSLQTIASILEKKIEEAEMDDMKLNYLWGYTFEKIYLFEEKSILALPYGNYSPEDAWNIVERFVGVRVHDDVVVEFKGMEGNSYLFHQYYIPGYEKIKDDKLVTNTDELIKQGLTRYIWGKYLVDKDTGQIRSK